MRERLFPLPATALLVASLLVAAPALAARYSRDFHPEDCTWKSRGTQNPYFSLRPGWQLVLEGEEDGEDIEVIITVLHETERIRFETPDGATLNVRARVVEERESEGGELVEVSRNFFALCRETGDVFYFGEDVDDYEDGEIVGHGGAWRAGMDDALPGIIMPGRFLLGSRYFQEVAPDVAMDRAKHVAAGLEIGDLSGCVGVVETTPLDPEEESVKMYCPGVGLVFDDDLELVEFGRVGGGGE